MSILYKSWRKWTDLCICVWIYTYPYICTSRFYLLRRISMGSTIAHPYSFFHPIWCKFIKKLDLISCFSWNLLTKFPTYPKNQIWRKNHVQSWIWWKVEHFQIWWRTWFSLHLLHNLMKGLELVLLIPFHQIWIWWSVGDALISATNLVLFLAAKNVISSLFICFSIFTLFEWLYLF